jgi:antitoxin VapB
MQRTLAKERERPKASQRDKRTAAPKTDAANVGNDDEQPRKAKLFMHGRSQAVRLPKDFRFPGKEVTVRRFGGGVLLQPVKFDVEAWFARLDSYGDVPFMPEGREQPEMPPDDEIDFDK